VPAHVRFLTETEDAAERFVREYGLGAVDRAEEIDGCHGVTFALNEPPNPEGGAVTFGVMGKVDAFVDNERHRWETHREAGLIEDWETTKIKQEQTEARLGEQGADLAPNRLFPLAAKMAKLAYEEFDEEEGFPAPVNAFSEDDGHYSVGWGMLPHHLTFANLGYSAAEEMEMYLFCIEEDLRIFAERNDEEIVDAKIDELISSLEDMRGDVKDGRPSH
jgi:hypothetical protein